MIMHIKDAALNIAGITGALIATAGGAAQALPLPTEILAVAPSAETSVHGLMTLVLVAMFKNMPKKSDAEDIAKELVKSETRHSQKLTSIDKKLDSMQRSYMDERVNLAEWTGGVDKTLVHHENLIRGVAEGIDKLRDKVA